MWSILIQPRTTPVPHQSVRYEVKTMKRVFLYCTLAMLAFVAIEAVPVGEEQLTLEDPSQDEPQAVAPVDESFAVLDDGEVQREKRHSRYGGYGGYGGYRGGYGGYGGYGYGRGFGGYGHGYGGYGGRGYYGGYGYRRY